MDTQRVALGCSVYNTRILSGLCPCETGSGLCPKGYWFWSAPKKDWFWSVPKGRLVLVKGMLVLASAQQEPLVLVSAPMPNRNP